AVHDTVARIAGEGHRAVAVVGDVADAETCESVIAASVAHLGGLDGLVLNVGIGAGKGLEGTSADTWDLCFAVNLRAHFLLCKAALPQLSAGGAVVFISSVAGLKPGSFLPAYDASKAGLFSLCRHVALEGARR